MRHKKAIVLVNTGSIESLNRHEYIAFMRRFLGDKNVVKLPFFVKLLLFYIIFPLRSNKILKKYKEIFLDNKNPYFIHSDNLVKKINTKSLNNFLNYDFYIAQLYTKPFVDDVLKKLLIEDRLSLKDILFIPLYPQFCRATTKASIDYIQDCLHKLLIDHKDDDIQYIQSYCYKDSYKKAIYLHYKDRIKTFDNDKTLFIITYHSMLKESIQSGDSYEKECLYTTKLFKDTLNLKHVIHTYQSAAGKKSLWLGPHLDEEIIKINQKGFKDVVTISPTFSIDCLETLHEIAIEYKEMFLKSGGASFAYLHALNDSNEHVDLILDLAKEYFKNQD